MARSPFCGDLQVLILRSRPYVLVVVWLFLRDWHGFAGVACCPRGVYGVLLSPGAVVPAGWLGCVHDTSICRVGFRLTSVQSCCLVSEPYSSTRFLVYTIRVFLVNRRARISHQQRHSSPRGQKSRPGCASLPTTTHPPRSLRLNPAPPDDD